MKRIAQVELVGLDAISEARGREFMPHPFAHTKSSPFSGMDEYTRYANDLLDRVDHGDLSELGKWFSSYVTADLRVECSVSTRDEPQGRIVAHRSGDSGYLAIQQPDDDVIDVYTLSPFELGAAIAGSVTSPNPGKHSRIVIPELTRSASPRESESISVTSTRVQLAQAAEGTVVSRSQIAMFARAQSRRQPAREWGFDRQKKAVVWVRINDDGDYIYAPGFTYLTPMSMRDLSQRIDRLIAEDIASIVGSAD
ncbi:ESX secretion-associated protein EspG [Mycobacteroides salmoniphilum]|uniref:ESX secretion-associated protein EspG n=1 Tax=Mycobacteroides salmoniphilum TaxID=404941 RepID=UPI00356970A4